MTIEQDRLLLVASALTGKALETPDADKLMAVAQRAVTLADTALRLLSQDARSILAEANAPPDELTDRRKAAELFIAAFAATAATAGYLVRPIENTDRWTIESATRPRVLLGVSIDGYPAAAIDKGPAGQTELLRTPGVAYSRATRSFSGDTIFAKHVVGLKSS